MRSITFGPTSYFESSLNNNEEDDQDNMQNNQLSQHERLLPQAHISYSSSQNNTSQRQNEVVFYSCDNLFRESLVGNKELAMKKNCKCRFSLDTQRTFQSYCYEFCGLLNIQIADIKFFIKNREVAMLRQIRKPCTIEVYHHRQSQKQEASSLKIAYSELLEKGSFSDVIISVNGTEISAHKCILIARSDKFKVMLQNQMKESIEGRIEIKNEEISPGIYKLLIQWIYIGESDLPESVKELIQLLKLTDEYLLPDLQKVCEEQIIYHMDYQNAVDILTNTKLVFPETSDIPIRDSAKSVLLDDYDKIEEIYPDIEERISKVKGLMSELFQHKRKKKASHRKRKGSVLGEDSHKKKVRFNISNTIYEEASAIHDESDSLIEPLSIYSASSPPGELNDDIMVSSTHSSLHALSYERRHSGSQANSQQLSQLISGGQQNRHHIGNLSSEQRRSHEISNEMHMPTRVAMSPTSRMIRPGSAGRSELNNHQTLRSSSTTVLVHNTDEQMNQQQRTENQQSLFGRNGVERFNSLI